MSALNNIHYGFRHHYKSLSPQIAPYLRVGEISDSIHIYIHYSPLFRIVPCRVLMM